MKTSINLAIISLLLTPTLAFASIDTNVFYGSRGPEVSELQEYLIANNYMTGEATGNFYSITKKAVIAFQTDKGLPRTGYVGVLTRGVINADLADDVQAGAVAEGVPVATPPVQDSQVDLLKKQNALLQQQVAAQTQTNQNLQTVITNTTPAPSPVVNVPVAPTPEPITFSDYSTFDSLDKGFCMDKNMGQPVFGSGVGAVKFETKTDVKGVLDISITTTGSNPDAAGYLALGSNPTKLGWSSHEGISKTPVILLKNSTSPLMFTYQNFSHPDVINIRINSFTPTNGAQVIGLPLTLPPFNITNCISTTNN